MLEELLDKINKLEKNMELLLELHLQQANSLTTYAQVAQFLGKSKKSIYLYIKNGKFELDKHYYKDEDEKIVFIPQAIIEYKSGIRNTKKALTFEKQKVKKEPKRIVHPTVKNMLKGVACQTNC